MAFRARKLGFLDFPEMDPWSQTVLLSWPDRQKKRRLGKIFNNYSMSPRWI